MRRRFLSMIVTVAAVFSLEVRAEDASSVFNRHRMATVRIEVAPDPASVTKRPIVGTGFMIGSDGFIVTAKHNLAGYIDDVLTPIKVRLGSHILPEIPAQPSNFDIGQDVALLKLPHPSSLNLPAYQTAPRGDSRALSVGNQLYVLSFPADGPIGVIPATLISNLGGGPGGLFVWEITAGGT
jgi:S1-C subfamily serine protease